MSSVEEQKNQEEGKGFAGLSSMVSDIDATLASASEQAEKVSSTVSSEQSVQPSPAPQASQSSPQSSGGASTGKWLFGIALVIGVIWIANQSDNNTSSRPVYSSGTSSASSVASRPTPTPTPAPTPNRQSPVAQPQAPSRPTEDKPPVGRNNVLSSAQIRYCLAEKIRIDIADGAINNYVAAEVNQFNRYVDDYNSRCGAFQYRQGALENARRDIEPYRSQLQAEGRSRFVRSPSVAADSPTSLTTQQDEQAPSVATIRAIQGRLNELGYKVGTADGLIGPRTRAAIESFQRDRGLAAVDGTVSAALLIHLDAAIQGGEKQKSNLALPRSSVPPPSRSQAPANSVVYGSNWYCKDGYKKVGDQCEAVKVPANAIVYGANWYCKDGYKKVGDQCEAVKVPANAIVYGANWYCKDGYKKVGDQCEAVKVPANAIVYGANWYCKDGYKKVGDKCISIFD